MDLSRDGVQIGGRSSRKRGLQTTPSPGALPPEVMLQQLQALQQQTERLQQMLMAAYAAPPAAAAATAPATTPAPTPPPPESLCLEFTRGKVCLDASECGYSP